MMTRVNRYHVVSSGAKGYASRVYGSGATMSDAIRVAREVIEQGQDPAPVIYETASFMLERPERNYIKVI